MVLVLLRLMLLVLLEVFACVNTDCDVDGENIDGVGVTSFDVACVVGGVVSVITGCDVDDVDVEVDGDNDGVVLCVYWP